MNAPHCAVEAENVPVNVYRQCRGKWSQWSMMRSLAKLKEDFIWSAASDDLPDEVTDLPCWSEYRSAALMLRLLSWGTRARR